MSLQLSRPARRLGVVAAAFAGLVLTGTGVASAHVTVSSPDATPGGYGKITFRVPDESDTASTVDLRVQLPTGTPITSVRAEPVPGWTVTLTTSNLPRPVKVGDDTVTTTVSVVEWKADAGGGIGPGQFQEFSLSGGPIPQTSTLTFNAVQTYSDGTQVAWIEPTVAGQPEPDHPAPVLTLSGSSGSSPSSASASSSATGSASGTSSDGGNGTAVAALVVGSAGLLAGLAGLALGLAARRRTVKP